jgi:hypothetical protein
VGEEGLCRFLVDMHKFGPPSHCTTKNLEKRKKGEGKGGRILSTYQLICKDLFVLVSDWRRCLHDRNNGGPTMQSKNQVGD